MLSRTGALSELWKFTAAGTDALSLSSVGQARFAKAAAKPSNKGGKNSKNVKAKSKKKGPSKVSTPMNAKDPVLQRVVSMYEHPETKKLEESPEQKQQNAARAKEFSRLKLAEHVEWQKDLQRKMQLKAAALAALPPQLRESAEKEDLTPFPTVRSYLYDTPPEAYRD